MREYPIIFSGPMVKAILDGRSGLLARFVHMDGKRMTGGFTCLNKQKILERMTSSPPADVSVYEGGLESLLDYEKYSYDPDGNGSGGYCNPNIPRRN